MPVTTFPGTVEDGHVKLAENVHLPENTKVFVVVPDFDEKANGKKFDLAELVSRMPAYVSAKGDFITLSFDPQAGHEQKADAPP